MSTSHVPEAPQLHPVVGQDRSTMPRTPGVIRQFFHFFWGTIVHPRATFDMLASERTLRWAIIAAALPVLQVWGNVALFSAFGFDWLGTKPILADPTFVAGFGHWRVNRAGFVPVFVALMPLLAWWSLLLTTGTALLIGKLWGGQGTFEQLITPLAFATAVPTITIGATSEWLFGVPINLISGHPYWWVAAMSGELGPTLGLIWNLYVFGVYFGINWAWQIALGTLAIRRVQKIPAWAAVVTMLVTFALSMFFESVFVR